MPEFDYCHFCKSDDRWGTDMKCKRCVGDNPPSEFEEKDSVKAYRKAMEKENE